MLKYDFHIHSVLSPCGDAEMTPNNIVNMSKILGLDIIAISDHNTIGNAKAVIEAGERIGLKVLPGMEVTTEEEVHILTLYPDIESAAYVAKEVYKNLPDIKNKPEIFGEQLYMDKDDNVTGIEEKLLISAASISINKLFDMVRDAGGVFIPAHVDKHSYSVLTNLGFIPDDLDIRFVEISKRVTDVSVYQDQRPDLKKYKVLQSSDSHFLDSLVTEPDQLDFEIENLFEA